MAKPRIVRAFDAGNTVWVNQADLIGALRDMAEDPPLEDADARATFANWIEIIVGTIANSAPAWVEPTDLDMIRQQEP